MVERKARHVDLQLASLREISERWSCHRTTVARILERAGIQPYVLTNRRNGTKRYDLSEVDAFMASCLRKKRISDLLQ